jgi:hypothetical protein
LRYLIPDDCLVFQPSLETCVDVDCVFIYIDYDTQEGICRNVTKIKCEEIIRSQCKTEENTYSCIWVEEENEGLRCQKIEKTCEEVETKISCLHFGVVVSDDNATKLSCIWIESNLTIPINGKCELKVYMIFLYMYISIAFMYNKDLHTYVFIILYLYVCYI